MLRLGALALRDVAPDAAIAHEATVFVEDRESGHGHMARAAVGRGAGELEVAERQMRVKRRTVPAPGFLVRLEVRHLPARLADFGARGRRVEQASGRNPAA